jgi:hypothetical protein
MTVSIGNSSQTLNKLETGSVYASAPPVFRLYSGMSNLISGTSHTMTASEALAGVYRRTAPSNLSDTLPTAASIVSQLNSLQGTVAVGDSFDLNIIRSAGTLNQNLTFSTSTGINFYGRNRFKGLRSSQIRFIVTNIGSGTESVDIYSLFGNL